MRTRASGVCLCERPGENEKEFRQRDVRDGGRSTQSERERKSVRERAPVQKNIVLSSHQPLYTPSDPMPNTSLVTFS